MKRLLILALFMVLAVVGVAQTKHFEAPAFFADFPEDREVVASTKLTDTAVGRVMMQNYFMQTSDGVYLVSYTEFPAQTTFDYEVAMESGIRKTCNPAEGAVVSGLRKFDTRVGQLAGRGAEYWCTETSGRRFWFMARESFRSDRLWQIMYAAVDDHARATVTTFFDSVVPKL